LALLQGFLKKNEFCCGVFCGENVVDCVVNVVRERTVFQVGKMGQGFELFFSPHWPGASCGL